MADMMSSADSAFRLDPQPLAKPPARSSARSEQPRVTARITG